VIVPSDKQKLADAIMGSSRGGGGGGAKPKSTGLEAAMRKFAAATKDGDTAAMATAFSDAHTICAGYDNEGDE